MSRSVAGRLLPHSGLTIAWRLDFVALPYAATATGAKLSFAFIGVEPITVVSCRIQPTYLYYTLSNLFHPRKKTSGGAGYRPRVQYIYFIRLFVSEPAALPQTAYDYNSCFQKFKSYRQVYGAIKTKKRERVDFWGAENRKREQNG